ncbi:hypothetical protein B4077_0853 [Bacillus cereus]|uniref:Uncharacterized protein n=1 Tax=Bacillus cereus TaxID=1396 RepID=A0A0G8EYP0_BACCE|nr:hypothetical protein B4077_0853 [Bacillus cereus]
MKEETRQDMHPFLEWCGPKAKSLLNNKLKEYTYKRTLKQER